MSNLIKPRTLSGFMELLPEKQLLFDAVVDVLRGVYSSYGFFPLDTPVLEASEVLLAKGGGETEKQIYRFTKGDADLSMRFDLTVPLAKYVALHYGELTFPFRRYQIGKVYRGERAQRGRYREFYQADIDIIGDGSLSPANEAEIPAIIYDTFSRLGLKRFRVKVNNRRLLSGFLSMLDSPVPPADVLREIDRLDKAGLDRTLEGLLSLGMSDEAVRRVSEFIGRRGTPEEILDGLEEYRGKNETFDQGLKDMRELVNWLDAFGVPRENFALDLTIARGLDYYTGSVYETELLDHPEIGSVCSGGRYDDLAGFYTNKKLPGVGISIGLTRLFYILDEMGYLNPGAAPSGVDLLVLPMTDELTSPIAFARQARESGLKVSIYYESRRFKAKMAYADKVGAAFAAIFGGDEISSGLVSLKDLFTGDQQTLTPAEAIERVKARVCSRPVTLIGEKNE